MKITAENAAACDVYVQFLFEGQPVSLTGEEGKIANAAIAKKEFEGKEGTQLLIRSAGGKRLLVGMGKEKEFEIDALRVGAARAACFARETNAKSMRFKYSKGAVVAAKGVRAYAQAITEGTLLSLYKFDKYKTGEDAQKQREKKLDAVCIECSAAQKGEVWSAIKYACAVCEGENFARDVGNEAGKDALPVEIAKTVAKMAHENGIKCRVLGKKECEKGRMGLYLSVAAGSAHEPAFVVLEYWPRGAHETVCLVGKGVTFDSGGISLKPSKDMEKMKHDKCGAAAVYGSLLAAAKLKLPVRVIGITPLVENLPSGSATKPGDIVKAANGKTVEILNTDAEGRLILADALLYAQKYKPSAIVDLATLTGAVAVALGPHAAGVLGNSSELIAKVKEAGESTHERVWELPLWKEYFEVTKGEFADIKNVGDGDAGTIVAAAFLASFVEEKTPWAHIDIAATGYSYKPKGYNMQAGATGFGVRLLAHMLSKWKRMKKK